jgi:nucleoside-diphosphate-sugar epimerase
MFFDSGLYGEDVARAALVPVDWRQLKGSAVLITGATGLIGTFLIDTLMYRNDRFDDAVTIYALGRNRASFKERFRRYLDSPLFHFVEQDVLRPFAFDLPVDYIVHGAANTHPVAYAAAPVDTILLSITGTQNVLDFASSHRVKRILFLSTVEVYGENRGDCDHFKEDYCGHIDCNTLRAGYPEGKRCAEALCQAYIKEKKLDVVIIRCCRVYGATMGNSDSKVIAQFLRNAASGKAIVLKSKGDQLFSYCHVADVCSALLTVLLNGKTGEAYNVANTGGDMTLRETAEFLATTGDGRVVFEPPLEVEALGYSKATKALLDNSKLRSLGWKDMYSLKAGLTRTVNILQEICG